MRASRGFSLLEVLVAFVILALSLAVVMRIFSGGLANIGTANKYTQALSLAQSRLDTQGREAAIEAGETQGEEKNGLSWQVRVTPYETESASPVSVPGAALLYRVDVRVQWDAERATPRSLELTTLRVATGS